MILKSRVMGLLDFLILLLSVIRQSQSLSIPDYFQKDDSFAENMAGFTLDFMKGIYCGCTFVSCT